jgi:Sec-independent protein translocase protein TatA
MNELFIVLTIVVLVFGLMALFLAVSETPKIRCKHEEQK